MSLRYNDELQPLKTQAWKMPKKPHRILLCEAAVETDTSVFSMGGHESLYKQPLWGNHQHLCNWKPLSRY